MIVDAHVHIGKSTRLRLDVDGSSLVRIADRLGFDKICCTDLTALFYDMHEGNRLLFEEMRRFPDRMIGYATISSPRFGQAAVEEIDRCFHDYGMRGLKIYSTPEASIAYPGTFPVLEKCAELGMPILAHATPSECEYLLKEVPKCKLMMAHAGGQPYAHGDWNRALLSAQKFPSLFLETASSTLDAGFVEAAVAAVGAEKIIFGTDTPLLDPFTQRAKIARSGISETERSLIMGRNILRLMGLGS